MGGFVAQSCSSGWPLFLIPQTGLGGVFFFLKKKRGDRKFGVCGRGEEVRVNLRKVGGGLYACMKYSKN